MKGKVKRISATGTGGAALGNMFIAKPNKSGQFVLNRKNRVPVKGKPTNHAANKVYVNTLDEAAELLATDEFLIHLVSDDSTRALREHKKVRVERY